VNKKVMVAMSGGVDSSVTAFLLQQQGYEVEGITMHLSSGSPMDESLVIRDAALTAHALGIKHHAVDCSDLFERTVITYFVESYKFGQTPNPCVRCNQIMKFGFLLQEAHRLGCSYFATGHYVRFENGMVRRATDPHKDQSYFLYPVYGIDVGQLIFPLGELSKPQVREIARSNNLPCADRGDSQDICFVPDGSYVDFVQGKLDEQPMSGPIVDLDGKVIGKHEGIYKYTTGQRKGLGALGKRMFVREIIPERNTVVAVEDKDLFSDSIMVTNIICGKKSLDTVSECCVQVWYRSQPTNCTIIDYDGKTCRVLFDEPVRAPSIGQSAVFYKDDYVIAGGIISGEKR
jgi:tRNA-specific 2-thiouridylase